MAETMCISYGSEYGVPVKIVRLAQTFGAGVSKDDNRVFAQFSKAVLNGYDIILHTKGETKRNYCYTTDAVRAIFTVLTKGEKIVHIILQIKILIVQLQKWHIC